METKIIKLNTGDDVLVDAEDFEELSKYNWQLKSGSNQGYATRGNWHKETKTQSIVRMHRQIMNPPKGIEIDHINGNRLDNRKSNLRFASRKQNSYNMKKITGSLSSHKGVTYQNDKKLWRARIHHDGKEIFLGCFRDELEAAHAYDEAALLYFGEYAKLNLPKSRKAA